jgi:hypothetical protein
MPYEVVTTDLLIYNIYWRINHAVLVASADHDFLLSYWFCSSSSSGSGSGSGLRRSLCHQIE